MNFKSSKMYTTYGANYTLLYSVIAIVAIVNVWTIEDGFSVVSVIKAALSLFLIRIVLNLIKGFAIEIDSYQLGIPVKGSDIMKKEQTAIMKFFETGCDKSHISVLNPLYHLLIGNIKRCVVSTAMIKGKNSIYIRKYDETLDDKYPVIVNLNLYKFGLFSKCTLNLIISLILIGVTYVFALFNRINLESKNIDVLGRVSAILVIFILSTIAAIFLIRFIIYRRFKTSATLIINNLFKYINTLEPDDNEEYAVDKEAIYFDGDLFKYVFKMRYLFESANSGQAQYVFLKNE